MPAEAGNGGLDAIVFDLGGVLVDWNPRYLYEKIIRDPAELEWFLREVCNGEWIVQQDHGRSWEDAAAQLMQRFPDHRVEIQCFRRRWMEMMRGPIYDSVFVLQRLHGAGHKLIACSNWAADTFEISRPMLPFLDLFHGIVISGQVGMTKPDPRIFAYLARQHSVALERCLFIDDSARNVAAARALGCDTIHYQAPEQLEAELAGRGLLSE